MPKFNLYPTSRADRIRFWSLAVLTLFGWSFLWIVYIPDSIFYWISLIVVGVIPPLILVTFSLFPEQISDEREKQYSVVIANIGSISQQLADLSKFLTQERAKIEESEAVLAKLKNERTQLEPVVSTNRETVDAILTAHAKTTASRVWKERVLGFISGVVTSLLASMLYEYLRR